MIISELIRHLSFVIPEPMNCATRSPHSFNHVIQDRDWCPWLSLGLYLTHTRCKSPHRTLPVPQCPSSFKTRRETRPGGARGHCACVIDNGRWGRRCRWCGDVSHNQETFLSVPCFLPLSSFITGTVTSMSFGSLTWCPLMLSLDALPGIEYKRRLKETHLPSLKTTCSIHILSASGVFFLSLLCLLTVTGLSGVSFGSLTLRPLLSSYSRCL